MFSNVIKKKSSEELCLHFKRLAYLLHILFLLSECKHLQNKGTNNNK